MPFQIDIILVYFIYGLAFFSLGLAMLLESGRSPLLAEARVLRPLAYFGLVHGFHEWVEAALLRGGWLEPRYTSLAAWFRLGILALSFACLIAFGLRVLRPQRQLSRRDRLIWTAAIGLCALLALLPGLAYGWRAGEAAAGPVAAYVDAASRYLLAVPGGILAALALHAQARQARGALLPPLAFRLDLAAAGFALYGLSQAFVSPLQVFPASLVNTSLFLSLFGLPVQVVRAGLAVLITGALIQAIHQVDVQRQSNFLALQQARMDALEQVRKDLVEREALRRELLRHTVIAQEDERARIARELHDETAQMLAAFGLHLAALRDACARKSPPPAAQLVAEVDRLQDLSRQMSDGLYRLVRDLRPAQLDDLGLVPALQYLVDEEQRRAGLRVELEIQGARQRLDPLVETVLFRIAQEALTNVARHAGVMEARVRLVFSDECTLLNVSDLGVGFDLTAGMQPPKGWGLAGMRERAASAGGELRLDTSPGHGTRVEVMIPNAVQ